ncbi:MAG: DEAD/DEAH box helicase [Candidatus Thermoplasmatota archaeon]
MVQFDSFLVPATVLAAIKEMGFTEASPIQEAVIPLLLEGRDVIGQAQTGTGKTAAFGIPLVVAALEGRPGLVLVPTRELAQQVCAEIDRIGASSGIHALALYGGAAFGPQARALERGDCTILVATPGRLRDHLERGTLEASAASIVVLDEADEMLKMGFIDEVTSILDAVGPERQTLLFSATMPPQIRALANQYMRKSEHVVAENSNDSLANANTEQFAVGVEHREKVDTLVRLLAVEAPTGTLVFRHTRETVDELVRQLRAKQVPAEALHGGMAQEARERVLSRLREGHGMVVVATNVAARGLDVDCISIVVNFDAPREAEAYVHRIGRTGRAGRDGKSFLFVTPADRSRLRGIERLLGSRLQWREIPSDAEVHEAIAKRTAAWLQALPADPTSLATVDVSGRDMRELAAALLAKLAPHEGLAAPPLEQRIRAVPVHHQQPRGRNERRSASSGNRVALTLNVGRDDGVRPGDIVGALTNEGGLTGGDIGRIDILPRMAVAEVPEERVEELFQTMANASIRGRRVQMRVADRWEFRAAPLVSRR